MERQSQILSAASSLLGIALLIIAGLNVSRVSARTFADEIAWVAAVALMLSCMLSYLAIRTGGRSRYERWADRTFMVGLVTLFVAVLVLASTAY